MWNINLGVMALILDMNYLRIQILQSITNSGIQDKNSMLILNVTL